MSTPHDTGGYAPSYTTAQRPPVSRSPDGMARTSSDFVSPALIAAAAVKKNIDWKKRAMIVDDPKVAGRDHPIIIHVRVRQLLMLFSPLFWGGLNAEYRHPRPPVRPQFIQ